MGERVVRGFRHGAAGSVGLADPEECEAGEGDAEKCGGKRGDGGTTRVGGAGPIDAFAGLEFGLGAELGVVGVHGWLLCLVYVEGREGDCQQNVWMWKAILN